MKRAWLDLQILETFVEWEIYLVLVVLGLFAYGFYRFFLLSASTERHRSLKKKFKSLVKSYIILSVFFLLFEALLQFNTIFIVAKTLPYIGFFTVIVGCVAFIQTCRLLILMYFFLTSMRTAVPILLVNIFSLILSLFMAGWIFTSLFGIQVAPLLATSAAFSIILGLALQDTLGNLFAGISLQLDNVFEIGNWVEIVVNGQKITGQVTEISWRSVNLIGFADDIITIPNRIVAQSQIHNWTRIDAPIIRSQTFRLGYDSDIEAAKNILMLCAFTIPEIKKNPQPILIVTEMTDSCVLLKIAYYIDNFGAQYLIGDELINTSLRAFAKANIKIANNIVELKNPAI